MILKTVFVIVIKLKWGKKNAKSSKTNSLNQKGSKSNPRCGYANLQSFGPVTVSGGVQKFPHRKERTGSGDHSLGPMLV